MIITANQEAVTNNAACFSSNRGHNAIANGINPLRHGATKRRFSRNHRSKKGIATVELNGSDGLGEMEISSGRRTVWNQDGVAFAENVEGNVLGNYRTRASILIFSIFLMCFMCVGFVNCK